MFDILPQPIKNFIDTIFAAPLQWLQLMQQMINNASVTAGKGVDLSNYFSFFGYMPTAWQVCVSSAITSAVLLTVLMLVKAGWNMYLNVKASGKWW